MNTITPSLLTIVALAIKQGREEQPGMAPRTFLAAVATIMLASGIGKVELARALRSVAEEVVNGGLPS